MSVCLVHISGNFSEVHIAGFCLVMFNKNEKTDVVCTLTLNLLKTTIVAPPSIASNGRWDLIRRLNG